MKKPLKRFCARSYSASKAVLDRGPNALTALPPESHWLEWEMPVVEWLAMREGIHH